MAAYPDIGLRFSLAPKGERLVDVAESGDIRAVDLGESTAFSLTLTHPLVNSADRDTLTAFYDTNKNSVNTITLAGEDYNITFVTDYKIKQDSASYFTLSATFLAERT